MPVSLRLRRIGNLLLSISMLAFFVVAVAPQPSHADTVSDEIAFILTTAEDCVAPQGGICSQVEALANEYVISRVGPCLAGNDVTCEWIKSIAESLASQAVPIAEGCIDGSNVTCQQAEALALAAVALAVADAEQCATGTSPICNAVVAGAEQLAAYASGQAQSCAGGSNALCNDLVSEAEAIASLVQSTATGCAAGVDPTCQTALSAIEAVVGLATSTLASCVAAVSTSPCANVVSTVESVATLLEQTVLDCANGRNSTCNYLVATADAAISEVEAAASPDAYVTGGGGVTPGLPDDPTDLVIDPTLVSAKFTAMASDAAALNADLAANALSPIPDERDISAVPPSDGPPASAKVNVTGQAQGNYPRCVPASVSTGLTAFGISVPVATLATEEHTNDAKGGGTKVANARRSFNRREQSLYYIWDHDASAQDLFSRIVNDIYRGHGAGLMDVDTKTLPWWADSTSQGAHVMAAYAYYTQAGGGFYVWDSAYAVRQRLPLTTAWAGNKAEAGEIVW